MIIWRNNTALLAHAEYVKFLFVDSIAELFNLNHLLRLPVVELAHYNWVLGIIKAVDRSELVLNLSFDNLLFTYEFIPEDERVDVLVTHPTVIFAAVLFITIL